MMQVSSVPLGEVASFVRGINFKPDDVVPLGTAGTVACMRTKNVQAELDLSDIWAVARAFVKRDEPYSDNDLVLQRDPRFKSAWYRNVESWRNGRILQN